jgi:hypothetical protein
MANARIRRSRRRRTVNRGDRVKPPPEAAQHQRPWTMRELLIAGPDDGGIDADQFQSGEDIVEAFRALTKQLGYAVLWLDRRVTSTVRDMSPREARLATIYLEWGRAFQQRWHCRPHVVVEWIEDQRVLDRGAVALLRRGLDLWERIRSEYDRENRAKRQTPQNVASGH